MFLHLRILFRYLHIIKYSKDYFKQVLPPALPVHMAMSLHYLKHHCQRSKGGGGVV